MLFVLRGPLVLNCLDTESAYQNVNFMWVGIFVYFVYCSF